MYENETFLWNKINDPEMLEEFNHRTYITKCNLPLMTYRKRLLVQTFSPYTLPPLGKLKHI